MKEEETKAAADGATEATEATETGEADQEAGEVPAGDQHTTGEITEDKEAEEEAPDVEQKEHAEPTPVARTDSYFVVDDKTRHFIHSKLRAYESRRRTAYTGKLESSSLYWRSFRDLMMTSVHETGRAERLVLGTARANAIYSDSMLSSYEDKLVDDKGGMVMDSKKRSKLLEVRSTQDYAVAPLSPLSGDCPIRRRNSSMTEERRSNMLSNLIDSQAIMADKFGNNSKAMESEIASELTQLRIELETKTAAITEIGDAIIAELEATETEVTKTWDSYYAVAVKALSSEGGMVADISSRHLLGGSLKKPADDIAETEIVEDCVDVWIVEMHYRVAVAYQTFTWEKASAELSKLFASMKETECMRRMNTREYLVAFTQRQERLFMSLPDVHTPVLKDLVGRDMDRSTLEVVVQTDIRKRAERLMREEAAEKKEKSVGTGLKGVNSEDGNYTLETPMQSELMGRAKVVERKGTGMMSSWKLSLAIVTVDAFLHLFDLPAGKVSLGSAPEVAFQLLVPKVELPTPESLKNKKGATPTTNFVKGWCDSLTPSESLCLPNCTISQPKLGRETASFDVQEAIFNTGASKMFGKTTTKKTTIRTINKKETQDWIAVLKARK